MKEVKKALYPNKTPPLGSEERESNPLHLLSSAMQAMKALIHLNRLFPMLAHLTWGFTLSLVVILDSKVALLQHHLLLQSSRGVVWRMRSRPPFLVIQTPVWPVAPLHLYIILLCHHSLTHPCTPGQECIGLHRTTTSRRMISRSSGLKLWRTPIPSLFDNCWQRGRRIRLNLQQVSLKVQGAKEEVQSSQVSLWDLYLFFLSSLSISGRSDWFVQPVRPV
jgi:hypothetical protein